MFVRKSTYKKLQEEYFKVRRERDRLLAERPVDLFRFQHDPDYRMIFPLRKRVEIYTKLGM
jgi:hypothetical protein